MHTPRHPRERTPRRVPGAWLLRSVVAFLAVWFVASGAVADEPRPDEQAPEAIARYDAILDVVGDLRAAIDRTAFDLDALAFEFAFDDIDTIVAWAADEIAFEPYPGLLRGPEGTLLARAGNALDQAVLVARLLSDAGFEARVALGELSDADADTLLQRALAPRPPPPAVGDRARMEDATLRLAGLLGMPVEALMDELDATFDPTPITDAALLGEVSARVAELEAALSAAGLDLGAGATERLRDEARSYAWVEARVSANQAWSAHHPTGLVPSGALEASEVLEGTVPEALQHRLRIEACIGSKEDDRLSRTAVMEPWENPTAVFVGQVLDYANAPNGFEVGPIGTFDLDGVLEQTNFFVPYFRGRVAPGALFFDLDGRALPPLFAGDQAAALIQSVGRAAASGLGALRGIGIGDDQETEDPDDIFALVGHGFDITLIAPGGEETTHTRWILDRIGAEHRADCIVRVADGGIDVGRALLQQHRIVLTTGAVPQGYLLDLALADLEARRDLLAFTLEQAFDPDPNAVLGPNAVGAEIAADQMLLFDLFDRPLGAAVNAGHAVRDEDAERVIAAAETIGPFIALLPGDAVDATAFGLGAEALRNLEADLARGSVVLVPTEAREHVAWWRVDPLTGTTLGVTADGRGQSMTEYTIQLYDMGFTVMFAVKGLMECERISSGPAKACCLLKAHLNNVTGLGLGGMVGGAFGAGAGLAFTLGAPRHDRAPCRRRAGPLRGDGAGSEALPSRMPKPDWDPYFMSIALAVRARADCTGNRVGAILVQDKFIVATGYNGTPAGAPNCSEGGCERCAHPERFPSGQGYDLCTCVHAEANALLMAARVGIRTSGSTIYTTMRPCFGCSVSLAQAGVTRVVYLHEWRHPDPAYRDAYEVLQARFPGGLTHLDLVDPEADWAVRNRRP